MQGISCQASQVTGASMAIRVSRPPNARKSPPAMFKFDSGAKKWVAVEKQTFNSQMGSVSAPCSGPGEYIVLMQR